MRRLLGSLILLTVLGLAAIWVRANPGSVEFVWQGYEVRFSAALFLLFALVFAVALLLVAKLFRHIRDWPSRLRAKRQRQRQEEVTQAVASGMMALSDGRGGEAAQAALQARKALPNDSLSLMLSAQAARLNGHYDEEEAHYRRMIGEDQSASDGQTGLIGLRGLLRLALEKNDTHAVRVHAQRALTVAPKTSWALEAMFLLEAQKGHWDKAENWLQQLGKTGEMARPEFNRRQAVLCIAAAQDLGATEQLEDRQLAMKKIQKALKLAPDFMPAFRLGARFLAGDKAAQKRKLARQIEKNWKRQPHPELAKAYKEIYPGRSALQQLKAVQKLIASKPQHLESLYALGEAAITARRWGLARVTLETEIAKKASDKALDQRYYRLMAQLESGENENESAARAWLDKALSAPAAPGWVSPTGEQMDWQALCPQTGAFDAFEWHRGEGMTKGVTLSATPSSKTVTLAPSKN